MRRTQGEICSCVSARFFKTMGGKPCKRPLCRVKRSVSPGSKLCDNSVNPAGSATRGAALLMTMPADVLTCMLTRMSCKSAGGHTTCGLRQTASRSVSAGKRTEKNARRWQSAAVLTVSAQAELCHTQPRNSRTGRVSRINCVPPVCVSDSTNPAQRPIKALLAAPPS